MPNSPAYASVLTIGRLHASMRLGVGEEERRAPQPVLIDVKLYYPSIPAGAAGDDAGYHCYYGISQKIRSLCEAREYRLIEYLVHEIHRLVRREVPEEIKIAVRLRKPSILLDYVEEGASYSHTDLPAYAWVAPEW